MLAYYFDSLCHSSPNTALKHWHEGLFLWQFTFVKEDTSD